MNQSQDKYWATWTKLPSESFYFFPLKREILCALFARK